MGVVNTDLILGKKQVRSLNDPEKVTDFDVLAIEDEARLTLHNAFDMLVPETDNVYGEALQIDLNTESPSAGKLAAKQTIDLAFPIDVCPVSDTDSEVPIPSGSRPAATVITSASVHQALGPADVSRWAAMPVLSPVPMHVPQNKEQLVCNITKQADTNILQANNKLFSTVVYPSSTVLLDKVICDQAAKVNGPGKPIEDSKQEELTLEGIPIEGSNNATQIEALDHNKFEVTQRDKGWEAREKSLSSHNDMCDSLVTCTAMAMPITSYSALTLDKRPFAAHTAMANAPSKKAMESVRVLKKFWGDLSSDDQESEVGSDRYVVVITEKDEEYTPYTSKRQKKKEKLQMTRVNSNEEIQTRSKKGAKKDIQ